MILSKMAAEDLSSENLPRHSAISRQIESLLQSPAEHTSCVQPCNRKYFKPTFREGQASVCSKIVATVPHISSTRGSSYLEESVSNLCFAVGHYYSCG